MKIDVEQVLASKAPKLAKRLPRFLIRYLKKIIHQEEINEILAKYGDLNHMEFIRAGLGEMGVTWKVEGMERIPKEGRYLFTSNHPFGGMDGLILAQEIDKHFGKDVRCSTSAPSTWDASAACTTGEAPRRWSTTSCSCSSSHRSRTPRRR